MATLILCQDSHVPLLREMEAFLNNFLLSFMILSVCKHSCYEIGCVWDRLFFNCCAIYQNEDSTIQIAKKTCLFLLLSHLWSYFIIQIKLFPQPVICELELIGIRSVLYDLKEISSVTCLHFVHAITVSRF